MSRSSKVLFAAAGLLLVLGLAGLFPSIWSDRGEQIGYPIGAILPLTGRGSTYGERALQGMELAVDVLNTSDPFLESSIRLIVEDSRSSAPQALTAFRKLIDVDGAAVVVGFILSDEALTCAPVADARQVVLFSTAAGSDKIRDAGDYVFRNRESSALQTDALAEACIEKFALNEAAIVHSNAANGISYRDSFRAAFERLGGDIVGVVGFNEGKTDYRAEVEQLRSFSPAAVYLAGLDQELGLILKQSQEVGFAPQFFASAGAISPKLLEIAGPGAEGLVCGSAPFDLESPEEHVRVFVAAYRDRYGKDPDFIAANSYDAIAMLARLFERGVTDSDAIKTALYGISDFPGVGGRTTFDPFGEVTKPIRLMVVSGGAFQPIR